MCTSTIAEVAMQTRHFGDEIATPRRASSIRTWLSSWRNDDWVASRFGLG